jgi:hypothetical protein
MDPIVGDPGRSTIYSLVITIGSTYYVTQSVGECTTNLVSTCAETMLGRVDNTLHSN